MARNIPLRDLWRATSLAGCFETAIQLTARPPGSAAASADVALRSEAYYNKGVAHAKLGPVVAAAAPSSLRHSLPGQTQRCGPPASRYQLTIADH